MSANKNVYKSVLRVSMDGPQIDEADRVKFLGSSYWQ